NASTLKIEDEYTTGEGPDGVGISFDDSRLYVTNTKEGTISIINVQTHESQKLSVGGKPELIHATPDRSILFISNFVANKVHILDTHTDNIIREITNLNGPEEAVISLTENRLYIVNFNINVVQVFDGKTYQKLPWEFITGKKPIGIMPVLSKKKLYVSNYGENSVYVYRSP
ncbi:MAG: YncE family protein, partial [Methanobacteriota archaeon]